MVKAKVSKTSKKSKKSDKNIEKQANSSEILEGTKRCKKFEYKKLNIQETFDFNISEFFSEAFEFIQTGINSGGSVFVYCVQGQSRSPTIICSYLMKRYQMSFKTAYKYVKKKHPMTQPNLGFIEQLSDYEKKLHENNPTAVTCSSCNCLIQ